MSPIAFPAVNLKPRTFYSSMLQMDGTREAGWNMENLVWLELAILAWLMLTHAVYSYLITVINKSSAGTCPSNQKTYNVNQSISKFLLIVKLKVRKLWKCPNNIPEAKMVAVPA